MLLLSAYDAASHRYWHQQLRLQFPNWNWTLLSLKDRYFAWRMGGNALSFKAAYDRQLSEAYDLVVATSMTDLTSLRSWYPHLSQVPNLLYFHENQFAYPVNHRQQGLLEMQLRSVLSACSADRLAFNSHYNRDTFLAGLRQMLNSMPDGTPDDLPEQLAARSVVLPVPLTEDCQPLTNKNQKNELHIIWNHRWEHDKGPEVLLALLQHCQQHPKASTFRFHLLGQSFKKVPHAMQQILDQHAAQLEQTGRLTDRSDYLATLQQADVGISTAYHDFQGLALQEAVACGCVPLAPDRLVYPEWYPEDCRYPSCPDNPQEEARHMFHKLLELPTQSIDLSALKWRALHQDYLQWLS